MLDSKLQFKPGQNLVLLFALNQAQLEGNLSQLQLSASSRQLTWLAYPKAGQLGTDLNRDLIRAWANLHQLDPVRQIAIDDTWSALRLKSLS